MSSILSKLYSQDCKFINLLTSKLITVITNCGAPPQPPATGKVIQGIGIKYETDAVATDVYTLTIEGYIQYIYYQAYNAVYPEIVTPEEAEKIYAIYDALQIPRPIL
jgi:hypothetical protein